jgi:hypothetical protein
VRRRFASSTTAAGGFQPSRLDAQDPVDIWYAYSQRLAPMPIKAKMRGVFKLISRLTGSTFAPGIDLAIEKRPPSGR